MLKTIMGLMKPDSGYTEIFGQPLDKVRERVSYVPQRESVDWDFPADVMDVVLMGRYRKNNCSVAFQKKISALQQKLWKK